MTNEPNEFFKQLVANEFKELSKEELAAREKILWEKARHLLTLTELELKELNLRKAEAETHMRLLQSILTSNSLLGMFGEWPPKD